MNGPVNEHTASQTAASVPDMPSCRPEQPLAEQLAPTEAVPAATAEPLTAATKKSPYTIKDMIFALLAFAVAGMYMESVFFNEIGLLTAASILATMALTAVYQILMGVKFSRSSVLYGAVLIVCAAAILYSDNGIAKFFLLIFAAAFGMYWIFVTFGNRDREHVDYMILFDVVKALFPMPFGHLHMGPAAVFSGVFKKRSGKTVRYVLLGILLGIVPTAVVFCLLLGDRAFSVFMDDIAFDFLIKFRMDGDRVFVHLFLSLPLGMYLFGALYSCARKRFPGAMTREQCDCASAKAKKLPLVTVFVAVVPILAVYLLYFFSQLNYYTSAFTGQLVEGYTYAEYARSGFFELCIVAVINLAVLALTALLTRFTDGRKPKCLTALQLVLCIFTLALIAVSQSKLILYVQSYGLTRLRLFTLCFTAVLALIFLAIGVKLFVSKMNLAGVLFALCVAAFCLYNCADTDKLIARYNISSYENGRFERLDLQYLYRDLSASAVPELIGLYGRTDDESLKKQIETVLTDNPWREQTLNGNKTRFGGSMNITAVRSREDWIDWVEENDIPVPNTTQTDKLR